MESGSGRQPDLRSDVARPAVTTIAALFLASASQLSEPGYTLTDVREVQEQCRRDGGTVSGEYYRGVVTDLECSAW